MGRIKLFAFLLCCLIVNDSLADSDIKLSFAGIPGVNYTSDGGFGFGAIGSMFGRQEGIDPYRYALRIQLFGSTKGQQHHYVNFDWLNAFNAPLRIISRVGYIATTNENYCGKGGWADCDRFAANENYLIFRYSEKMGKLLVQYELKSAPHKIELFAMYRGSIYVLGSLDEAGPYPDSLFAQELGTEREEGFASVLYLGCMIDNRDTEASPTSGYWAEASIRESSKLFGSEWQYVGANISARGYFPIDENKKLVIASQLLFDVMYGAAPLQEIVRLGNVQDFTAFGGPEIGRGLREQYFPGRFKLIQQIEARYRILDFSLFSQQFNLYAVGFGDLGLISWHLDSLESEPAKAMIGFGSGFRLAWNKDFVIRGDFALSPVESYSTKIYLKVGNVF